MAKSKPSYIPAKADAKPLEWLWCNDQFLAKYPALFELLSSGMYEGEPRKGATITLFASEGRLKACVTDRQTDQSMYLSLEPYEDILAEIELLVAAGTHVWRSNRKNGHEKPPF